MIKLRGTSPPEVGFHVNKGKGYDEGGYARIIFEGILWVEVQLPFHLSIERLVNEANKSIITPSGNQVAKWLKLDPKIRDNARTWAAHFTGGNQWEGAEYWEFGNGQTPPASVADLIFALRDDAAYFEKAPDGFTFCNFETTNY